MRNLTIQLPSTDILKDLSTKEYARVLNVALDNFKFDLNRNIGRVVFLQVTSAKTLTAQDELALCNGTFTITLPGATSSPGDVHTIKNVGSGTITVTGTENIDGASTYTLTANESVAVVSDGVEWWAIAAA